MEIFWFQRNFSWIGFQFINNWFLEEKSTIAIFQICSFNLKYKAQSQKCHLKIFLIFTFFVQNFDIEIDSFDPEIFFNLFRIKIPLFRTLKVHLSWDNSFLILSLVYSFLVWSELILFQEYWNRITEIKEKSSFHSVFIDFEKRSWNSWFDDLKESKSFFLCIFLSVSS